MKHSRMICWAIALTWICVAAGCQSGSIASDRARGEALARVEATVAVAERGDGGNPGVHAAAHDGSGDTTVAGPSAAVEVRNPAVMDRSLAEIMPGLFITETELLSGTDAPDPLATELAAGAPAPAEPVPIASLWHPAPPVPLLPSWQETENYLILGTDRRADESFWRTDVIMVVGLDRKGRRAAVFSIPRDLYVPIPQRGWGRINTVDFIGQVRLNVEGGGAALVADVLQTTLGIPIQHWMRVDMRAFEELVDAVGGVTIHLECPFYEPIIDLNTRAWTYFSLPPGEVTLNGEEAHWYARLRLRESDFGRAQRQRQLLWALRDKMLRANLVLRIPDLWRALDGKFDTDLSLREIVELAQFGLPLNASRVSTGALTYPELSDYTTPDGGAVLRIRSTEQVQAKLDSLWDGPFMSEISRPANESCPPPPPGAPIFLIPTPVP